MYIYIYEKRSSVVIVLNKEKKQEKKTIDNKTNKPTWWE